MLVRTYSNYEFYFGRSAFLVKMGIRCLNGKRPRALLFHNALFLLFWCSSPIMVQAPPSVDDRCYENVAIGKPTRQINTMGKSAASKAVDGNASGRFGDKSCTLTRSSKDTWWVVDLLQSYNIYAVQVRNRDKQTAHNLKDFYVYVSETNPLPLPPSQTTFSGEICLFHKGILSTWGLRYLPCENNTVLRGRYVYVWKPGDTGQLALCEVEALTIKDSRESTFTLNKGSKSEAMSLRTEYFPRATRIQCVIFCLSLSLSLDSGVVVAADLMQFDEEKGECSCFEVREFEDVIGNATTSHKSVDVIERH